MSELTPLRGKTNAFVDPAGVGWTPHPRPFVAEITIDHTHLSRAVPHVNNLEYVRWLDGVAELHATAVGCTRSVLLAQDRCFFVARHEVDYLAECWEHDQLIVATWVRSMKKTSSWRETVVVRPNDDTIVCRAKTLWAFVDLQSRRPARIPAAIASAFDALEGVIA
ncbi:MAG: acyl-CoA thioesterase [Phycisphaerae bacterium]|nr:acyl-CoA thioesterase [Phycisphaerae bacterium]